uniref:Major facilitator superfamily (MFS) profile domain-containing protein n=1 Tax=Panagrolaimus sp. JU765 TaxID=591449 RepID=A0AC34Q7L8_9BILA
MKRFRIVRLFFICAVLSLVTNFPSGFTNSSVNTAVNELRGYIRESFLRRGWTLSDTVESIIRGATLNCWFVAQILGALMSPIITDTYGRRVSYMISNAVLTIAAMIQYVAAVTFIPELLILGRSMAAFASPLSDATLILYLQEATPVNYRGTFSFLGEIGYCLVCVLGMILGMQNVLGNNLPHLLLCAIFPGLPFALFLLFIPETPKFLMIVRKDRESALKSLEFFQGEKKENEKLLDDFLMEDHEGHEKQSSIKELLTTWHLRRAILLSCAVLVLTLSFYPILQSSTYFFQSITIESGLAEMSSTALMLVFTISCVFGSLFIDRYPRRFLVLTFGSLSNIFLTMFVVCSVLSWMNWWMKYAALASMFLYAIAYGMVLGPISWFVAPELVSQRHRSTVFCFCYGVTNFMIALTNFATVPLYHLIGAYTLLPLFIIPSFFCLLFLYHYLPETLKKETHEIISAMASHRARVVSVTEA